MTTIYSRDTGLILAHYDGPESQLANSVPAGCDAIDGTYDGLSQRYDAAKGQIVDYQPPAPDADHEWIHDDPQTGARVRRWVLKPEVAEQRARLVVAKAQIADLEAKQQRAMREAFLNPDDTNARQRVSDIDEQIARIAVESGLRSNST